MEQPYKLLTIEEIVMTANVGDFRAVHQILVPDMGEDHGLTSFLGLHNKFTLSDLGSNCERLMAAISCYEEGSAFPCVVNNLENSCTITDEKVLSTEELEAIITASNAGVFVEIFGMRQMLDQMIGELQENNTVSFVELDDPDSIEELVEHVEAYLPSDHPLHAVFLAMHEIAAGLHDDLEDRHVFILSQLDAE